MKIEERTELLMVMIVITIVLLMLLFVGAVFAYGKLERKLIERHDEKDRTEARLEYLESAPFRFVVCTANDRP